jgi:hypothetical protein
LHINRIKFDPVNIFNNRFYILYSLKSYFMWLNIYLPFSF